MSGHGHAPDAGENKSVGLGIATLALFLAVAEILGHKAQVATLQSNIEASNLWSFFQAKSIRRTVTEVAADQMQVDLTGATNAAVKAAMEAQIAKFRQTAARMESEPETKEGRKELMARAKEAEKARDKYERKLFRFSLASGSFQIAIVIASASLITGVALMLWGAGGLAALGLILLLGGLIA
jgi:predicted amino acid dehydrogenase